jgi:hypothetical protein
VRPFSTTAFALPAAHRNTLAAAFGLTGEPRPEVTVVGLATLDLLTKHLPGRITATTVLGLYKDPHLVELTHRANKSVLNVRPIFLHNDDRITALVSIVGLALLIYGLIETDLRQALGPDQHLPGLLPEGRAARPTGRNMLAAFQGLGATYTPNGLRLDRLTHTQRVILNHLNIALPWPEQGQE